MCCGVCSSGIRVVGSGVVCGGHVFGVFNCVGSSLGGYINIFRSLDYSKHITQLIIEMRTADTGVHGECFIALSSKNQRTHDRNY